MPYARAGAHSLHIARPDDGPVAHGVLVREFTGQHVADDFHVAMAMRAEARARLHSVLVDDPQGAELDVLRVEVIGK